MYLLENMGIFRMTQDRKLRMKGCLYAFLAGVLWGVTSPAAQFLFEKKGIVSEWLVPYRLISAGILLLIYAKIKKQDIVSVWKDKNDGIRLVLFGILGMMGMQFTFFSAVQEMNAGTATIFQYLNPAILILFFAVVHKIMPSVKEMLAVCAAVAGIAVVATHGDFSTLTISGKGLFLGMLVAVTTCFYGVLPAPLLKRYSAETVSAWGMICGGTLLMAVVRPWRIPAVIDWQVIAAFLMIITVGTILPFCFYLSSVKYTGSVYAGLFSSVEPVAATVVAAAALGTTFMKMDLLGFALVLSTLFILAIPEKVR
ncbi:EamA family transporter [Faecalicatena orotica]|uniref:Threonine/homoserine efflux transporter RhtA n=3 Tax=Bacillota TaxID=1239 RepID=A0A2Y9C6A3_9FIRM|nr:threonine/homoserine efflux transporter RhtA [Faecalicatena orotica]SSA57769.1 Threonine/homoserine efflux transporter RhtA [Faecalicatena orotica]